MPQNQKYNHPPTTVFGPFEIIDHIGIELIPILSRQYSEVSGSQTFVSVVDNVYQGILGGNPLRSLVGAEIGIFGSVQGYETVLKKQFVRNISGPMAYRFDNDEPYDRIVYKARSMTGGAGNSLNNAGSEGGTRSIKVTVYIQARILQ